VFVGTGAAASSLTGFQFGAASSTAVRTMGLSSCGSVASAPTIGFCFGTGKLCTLMQLGHSYDAFPTTRGSCVSAIKFAHSTINKTKITFKSGV